MTSTNKTETVALRCRSCYRLEMAPDRFCRWCGFPRREASMALEASGGRRGSTTMILEHEGESFGSISSLALNTLAQSVAEKTGPLSLNRGGALLIAVLTAIPMWLLIILLSPFDAYVRAKATWDQIVLR